MISKLLTVAVAAALTTLALGPSEARPRLRSAVPVQEFCGDRYCPTGLQAASPENGPRRGLRSRTGERTSRAGITRRTPPGARDGVVSGKSEGLSIPREARGLWCGWWMGVRKGLRDRGLYVARAWADVGRAAPGPAPGVIGVERHHVYEVVEVIRPGLVMAISGNDGGAVRTRPRSTGRTFAWRVL